MECLKCGRETNRTFCDACREEMKKNPVKPNTVVQIYNRDQLIPKKPPRKAVIPPEEKIRQLKRQIVRLRWANAILAALMLVLCMVVFLLFNRHTGPLPGQNYSTTRPTESTAVTVEETKRP